MEGVEDVVAHWIWDWVSFPRWMILLATIVVLLYWDHKRKYSYFSSRGIPGPTPYPVVGTNYLFFTQGVTKFETNLVKQYGKVVGLYESVGKALLVADRKMLSDILVKEFGAFSNRNKPFDFPDEILQNMMTMLDDGEWKRVRSLLTPTFSSGKLKYMADGINRCTDNWKEHLNELADNDEAFEMKAACAAFTMDLTARTAFGIDINSHKDPDNDFIKHGKKMTLTSLTDIRIIIAILFPILMKPLAKLGVSFFDKKGVTFFSQIIEQTLKTCEKGDKSRQDFIQLMANAHQDEFDAEEVAKEASKDGISFSGQNGKKKGLNRAEVLAQGFIFFVAGYENIANSLSLLLYCLAVHEDCQSKAQREIDDVVGDKEDISYNDARSMVYLDQCLQESLRLYTLASRVDRKCDKDIVLNGVHIEKGTAIVIPIHSIHMDPEIWPEPTKFDPERFSPEERAKHTPFDHMPFGYGPRNCIAMRLAILETKMAAAAILKSFNVVTCEKTDIPMKFSSLGHSKTQNGIWLKVNRR